MVKQGAATNCPPRCVWPLPGGCCCRKDCEGQTRSNHTLSALLTTRRAHLAALARESGGALEPDERLIALQGLANVLGTFCTNAIAHKAARVKQGGSHKLSAPADNKASKFGSFGAGKRERTPERASPMCWAPSAPILFSRRLQGPNKEQPQTVSTLLTAKRAHLAAVVRGSGRALQRGESRLDLESLTDVLGALNANGVPPKSARAKQEATTNCEAPADNKAEHILTWYGGEASAHLSVVSTLLLSKASLMCLAPFGPMLLPQRLQGPNKEQPHTVRPC
eukprot:scaffold4613_cov129-Isochrysis_galbana.AAC.18